MVSNRLTSSHLTQPLDIGIFGPLKRVLSRKLAPLLLTQVHRIQKAEWLSAFIEAHNSVFRTRNIQNSFTGTGLVPFNPNKVLHRVTAPASPPRSTTEIQVVTPTTPTTPFPNAILTSSPTYGNSTHKANMAVIELMASDVPLDTLARNYITCMVWRNNQLQAKNAILEQRVEVATKVLSGRKKRLSGKRHSIKGKNIMTGIELDLITKAESATKQRKQKRSDTEPTIRNIARTSSTVCATWNRSSPNQNHRRGTQISTISPQPQGLSSCDSEICETDVHSSLLSTHILSTHLPPQLQADIASAYSSQASPRFPALDCTTPLAAPLHTDSVLRDSWMDDWIAR